MIKANYKNGVTFIVEKTGETFNSLTDWGLQCVNTDRIGDPEQYTNYVVVPGLNKKIDLTETVIGRTTYTHRPINITFSGIQKAANWEGIISSFRNKINGKICKIIFDNDPSFFWRGRVEIKDFVSVMRLGTFNVSIPEAEPYKYNIETSTEPWKWDPFSFVSGVITYTANMSVNGTKNVTIPKGHMVLSPIIIVERKDSASLTVTYKGKTYNLKLGSQRIPSILINGDSEETLTFNGNGIVTVEYRGGSL